MTIGPIQLLALGFSTNDRFTGEILDEIDRLQSRGTIRLLDLLFVMKDDSGELLTLDISGLDDFEREDYGAVLGALMGFGFGGEEGALEGAEIGADVGPMAMAATAFGLDPDDLERFRQDMEPGTSAALLLVEHQWMTPLRDAVRQAGGYPIAQGFLTQEALALVGRELGAVVEAVETIEAAEVVKGAAILDALIAVEEAEEIKQIAAAEAVRALIAAEIIEEAAADRAAQALVAAELIEEAAYEEAAAALAATSEFEA